MVRDGIEAFVAPPESPDRLCSAIEGVLADTSVADQMVLRGRVRLETDFGFESWLTAHETIYRKTLAGH